MNHIYKSIFNKALGVFTAVPEFASAHGKGSERTVVGRVAKGTAGFAASALAISIGLALSSNAMANVDTDVASGVLRIADTVTHTNSIRMGTGTTLDDANKHFNSISIGTDASVGAPSSIALGSSTKTYTNDSIAIGTLSEAGGPAVNAALLGTKAIAIGYQTKALGTSNVALGYGSVAENGHDSIAIGIKAKTSNIKSIAIGAYSEASGAQSTVISDNYGAAAAVSTASGTRSQVYGVETTVSGNNSVAIGDTNNIESARTYAMGNNINAAAGTNDSLAFGTKAGVGGANAIALGNTAKATQDNSIAQGTESATYGKNSVSIGYKAISGLTAPTATQTNAFSVSIGNETEALDASTIAIGDKAKAKGGVDALAVGTQANAMTYKALAIGAYSQATGRQSTVIGNDIQGQPSIASGTRSQIIGVQSNVSGDNSVSIGDTNTIASARTYAIGNNINVAAGADDSLVFGTQANVGAVHSIAMGTTAAATGIGSIALGKSASATEQRAIAMGENALAGNEASMALGYNSSAKGSKQVSIGLGAGALKNATDAGAELATFVGHYAGADNASPTGNAQGVAVGVNAGRYGVSGIRNVAVGPNTGQKVEGDDNTAIGYNSGRGVKGTNNFAGGANAGVFVEGNNNVALGFNAGIGAEAKPLKVNRTTAVGSDSRALADDSVALGDHAIANNANSVAIGTRSTTSDIHTGDYTLNGSYTAAGSPVAANGTVSVGSAGKERQIQNVAAGVISATSTDAINGSQLYATNNYMNNLAGDVKTKLGGNAALGNDGHLTMTNIGGTGKGNVNDAIAAANTKVAAGENITVTPTTNTDGSKTYTVATKKDLIVDSVKAGDTTVNTDGVTITGGPSVKKDGINAGNKKITGVANGNVAAGSTDAVNGGQLAEVKAKADSAVQNVVSANPTALTATKAGDTVTLTPNVIAGDLVNPATGAVNTPAAGDAGKLVTAGTVANALANTHFVVDTKATTGGELDGTSQADQKIKSGNKVTLQAGKNLKAKQTNAADGATVEFSLKDSISLTQVTAGTGDNQVVLGNNGVQVGGNTYINKDGLNANNKPISNVADGVKPKDAVNKGQLDAVAQEAAKHTTVKAGKNVEVTESNNAAGGKEYTVKTADNLNVTSVKAGDTTVNTDGVTITGGPSVKKDGINAGNKKITDVADGNVAPGSKEAVNGGQLAEVKAKADSAVQNVVSTNPTALTANKVGDTVTLTPNFIAGDLVNADGTVKDPAAADEGKLVSAKTVADALKANHFVVDTKANGGKVETGSEADAKVGSGNKVIFEAGKNLVAQQTNTANGGATVNYKLSDTLENLVSVKSAEIEAGIGPNKVVLNNNGVKVGDSTLNDKGLTINNGPSVTDAGIDAGNKKITGVANGNVAAGSTDAVNGGQLAEVKAKADSAVQDVKSGDENALTAVKDPNTNIVTVTPKLSGDLVDTNGNITAPTTPEEKGKLVTAGTVAEALANTHFVVDTKATDGELDAASQADQKIKASNKVTLQAGKNLKAKQTNGANGAEVEFSLKDSISLKEVKVGEGSANEVVLNNNGVNVAGNTYINKDGLNANDKKITNVAPGAVTAASKDAVNGSQLYNVANNVKDLIGPDAAIDPATGKVTVADPAKGIAGTGKGTIGEAIKSVKDKADTAVQDIKSGDDKALSVTKAGNTYTITPNLSGDLVDADGNITAPATDADKGKLVTAGTVAQALANTHFVVDTKATDGELDGASEADQKIKAGNKVTLQAGKNLKAKQTNGANGAQVEFSLKDSISLKEVTAGEGDNQVVLGNDGVKVGGNTYINKDGLNANNKVISNVADGVNPNDAVNKGQLDAVGKEAAKHTTVKAGKNVEVTEGTNAAGGKEYTVKTADNLDVTSVKAGDSTLNTDGLTIAGGPSVKKDGINAGDKKITNVAPGAVTPTSKDAVNGSQLYNVANNVKDLIGPDATIDPATGKVTVADPIKGIGGTGKGNIGDAIQSVKDAADKAAAEHTTVKAGKNIEVEEGTNAAGGKEYTVKTADNLDVTSVKAGDTTVNNDGLTIAGGPSVKKDGIDAGDKKITNVADGVDAADAVNKGQLDKVAQNVVNVLGGNATVNGNGDITMSNIGDTGKGNVNDAIKAVNDLAKKAAAEKTSVKAKDGRSNVTVTEDVNAAGGHEYTVDVERAVTEAGSDQVTVTSKHDADSNTTTYTVDVSDKTKASLAKADSAVQGLTSKDGNLNFNKDPNGNVEVSFNDNLNVKNVTTDRVQVANGPSMSKDGINAAGKAISNVANGNVAADSKDAVNGGQLYDTAKSVADVIGGGATVKDGKVVAGQNGIGNTGQNTVHGAIAAINQNTANNFNQIRGDLRKMDRDLRGGIAGALATAGLPQAFRPGKSMVAAAASTYRGQSGLAIGVSRISDNGKVILKVTGNTNSRGDFGGTIGAGYQW